MATHYPIVFEQEESGAYSAYVAGLPVYAQGATRGKAATAIVRTLGAYLEAHPEEQPRAEVRVAKVSVPDARSGAPEGQPGDGCRAGREPHQPTGRPPVHGPMAVSAGGRERPSLE